MNKLFLVSALLLVSSASVSAAVICDGSQTASGTGTAVAAGTNFVVSPFTPKCSPNVALSYAEDATTFAVAAGSKKGKTYYSGNTNGGGITKDSDCPATGCTSAQVETNVGVRLSASS